MDLKSRRFLRRRNTVAGSAEIRRERDREMGGSHQGGEHHGRVMARRPCGRGLGAVLAVVRGLV
jgi:hypothetical protein